MSCSSSSSLSKLVCFARVAACPPCIPLAKLSQLDRSRLRRAAVFYPCKQLKNNKKMPLTPVARYQGREQIKLPRFHPSSRSNSHSKRLLHSTGKSYPKEKQTIQPAEQAALFLYETASCVFRMLNNGSNPLRIGQTLRRCAVNSSSAPFAANDRCSLLERVTNCGLSLPCFVICSLQA